MQETILRPELGMWPESGKFLIPGFNDSWNNFQKFSKGTSQISTADWRLARAALRKEYEEYVANGGTANEIPEEWQRYFVSPKLLIYLFPNGYPISCLGLGRYLLVNKYSRSTNLNPMITSKASQSPLREPMVSPQKQFETFGEAGHGRI